MGHCVQRGRTRGLLGTARDEDDLHLAALGQQRGYLEAAERLNRSGLVDDTVHNEGPAHFLGESKRLAC